jgi:CRISPR-associated protein Cas1
MIERTILINQAFALRQKDGAPVFTSIETEIIPHSQDFMEKYGIFEKIGYKLADRKKRIKTDHAINLSEIERIILTPNAKGYISTFFFEFAKTHLIPIYWVDRKGRIDASFIPFNHKKTSTVIKQCEARTNGRAVEIAKYLIRLKLESQRMEHLIPKLNKSKDIKDILQVEGNASRAYYQQWVFGDEWRWNGRHGRTSINVGAIDPINACLNLGYSLLAQQMSEILLKKGFELSIGFMHMSETSNRYWNMLAYDMLEPYRIWTDGAVREMVADKEIKPTDFTFTDDKSYMVLKDDALEIALDRFLKTLEPLEHKSLPIIRTVEKML